MTSPRHESFLKRDPTCPITGADLWDVGRLRPFFHHGRNEYLVNTREGLLPVPKPAVHMTQDDWLALDRICLDGFRRATPFLSHLLTNRLVLDVPNGLAQTVLTEEPAPAGHPKCEIKPLPLPIIHSDLDEAAAETVKQGLPPSRAAVLSMAFRVGEMAEKRAFEAIIKAEERRHIHTGPGFEERAIELLHEDRFYGPHEMLVGKDQRAAWVESRFLRTTHLVDTLPPNAAAVFQATADVVRVVIGLNPTLVVWGDRLKLLAIAELQVRRTADGKVGIVTGDL